MKAKLFKEDNMRISIHKAELVKCGSSDQTANLQGFDFGTGFETNNLVAKNVPIFAENLGDKR